jgi:protein arginine kinase activator
MRCEHCGEREAAIHLTQIVNGAVTASHLCEACAAAKGVATTAAPGTFPLGDFLATLGKAAGGAGPEPAVAACPRCGAALQDFRDTGRLGCAQCWEAFAPQLRELLRRLHGSTVHVGEGYAPGAGAAPLPALAPGERLAVLRRQLQQAVATEDFERAAELRDRIRELECST